MDYTVKYRRRKTIELRIDRNGEITVIAPLGYPKRAIVEFVYSKENWVNGKLEKIMECNSKKDEYANSIKNGGKIWILGKRHGISVEIIKGDGIKECVNIENGMVTIKSRSRTKAVLKTHMENHLREMARSIMAERISFYEQHIPARHNSFRIKNQKTIWGSCSAKRNLNFNFRLVMAPVEILDYVVVHELCHIVHMDHSAVFWNLVGSIISDYNERRHWLRENGPMLEI
ncbi:hypothetical protein SAMN02745945_00630 [Peptoclostridium litorale DSM 5388]|uniref:YgjP-like metallopeptidase domain-containing protein n=1 Tax=Peptoclostridium litorale DSM 5388 TaxID=1121324 RepID=A0A069RD69_PEPLI|nr:SprT family zinc-dependent metalloprotease [Peptoclostridium litorale]KDR95004.1 hypothetical protein CLIT_11c00310 [Peptoclostridium litorale DSM 5388]SIN76700.1 hypothetical protein SAMN02745945_00630 [Peptoclostridium litorale DSM 5388]